jgi:hypothetical protein
VAYPCGVKAGGSHISRGECHARVSVLGLGNHDLPALGEHADDLIVQPEHEADRRLIGRHVPEGERQPLRGRDHARRDPDGVDHAEGVVDVEPALIEHVELVVVERYVHGDRHGTRLPRQAHDRNARRNSPRFPDEECVAGNVMDAQP